MSEAMTLNSAQRRYLKQLAHHLKPLLQMGKDGPSAGFIGQLNEQIENHELIKIRILNNCEYTKSEIETAFAGAGITLVQKVGHVYTVFRQKEEDSQLSLPK
ncbi:MAG: ribosome assembly RNA-binding protein YhbY [Acidobacteriota bacterium]|nr:ribosome assembly RNA-binding protein YhbY [Acidobacteriota bacterium]